ncbi:MAG TPA: FAD-dependent oxidoreductase, partial [Planctomycetota bacterium]|nr:FAD-dependent oxidoreductase [Planctomycetota bacterium]
MGGHIVVVGGVAAGASAAAKARRVSEEVEITLIEAGPYISFANCGLPYYVGGEIAEREKLFVTGAEKFSKRFNVSVRTRTRVTAVDASRKCV